MKYWFIIGTGVSVLLIETWYFGWNVSPQSKGEEVCDFIAKVIILVGIVKYFINEIAEAVKQKLKD